ncbi:MAG: 4Fe-4S binding protein [Lachnospiraceae bacterium]|nr:4Fe-4S binding protein [Lachnospiraceae bacterium]
MPGNGPNKTDNGKCISCMRCVSICPIKARTINPLRLAAGAQKMKKSCSEYKQNELFL